MLNPDHRTLYTDALRPPPGYRFKDAVATTYSLDLQTLLTIPLHLALFSAEGSLEEMLKDGVALLESLRRAADHITVYAQSSRILAPRQPHVLFGLLESMVVEVNPPSDNGVFHPKVWMIRFENPDTGSKQSRLLVLSRNLTHDRSWDLALTLEGHPGDAARPENRPLARFVRSLPDMAVHNLPAGRRKQTRALAQAARRTKWDLPHPFKKVRFHPIGLTGKGGWLPEESDELAVISPFLSEAALGDLIETTWYPTALISRGEELDRIDPDILEKFEQVFILAEQAEREDGEEPSRPAVPDVPTHGLHAKAYVTTQGARTRVYVGSANATNPALKHGSNVEFVAELIGRTKRVGGVADLIHPDGLGALLWKYEPPSETPESDPAEQAAEERLEQARRALSRAALKLRFTDALEGTWGMTLTSDAPPDFSGIDSVRAWLVTRQSSLAVDAASLQHGEPVDLPSASASHLTSFVAFELTVEGLDAPAVFVLTVETEGMPVDERDAAIVRDVLRNKDGFLRYVLLLLAEAGLETGAFGQNGGIWKRGRYSASGDDLLPLFEQMTRAYCQDPGRLSSVDRLLKELGAGTTPDGNEAVVPPDFLELWAVFQAALEEHEEQQS